jgi:hypothetical protein
MITTLERLRRAQPSVCSDCGWGKIINENNRYACVNPHCSGSSRENRKKRLGRTAPLHARDGNIR